jgi:dihydrofolate reductase
VTRVQYYAAASLDGYIAAAGDNLDWLTKYEGSYEGEDAQPAKGAYDEFYEGVGALVCGSVTYEWVLDHLEREGSEWPYKGKPCWILSSRELGVPKSDDVDVRVVEGPIGQHAESMMESAGDRTLWVVGGGNVASQFADEGLLDELIVTVVPVVLGAGKTLFDHELPGGAVQLTAVVPRDSGMVELRYELQR